MNQGGEPGHDDYGLPRVDIEIPDDARELYRDVQAYHRELRALRRHQRSRRFGAPLRRTGIILPLAAGCLVLALISGMVLTVFSADPYLSGFGGPAKSGSAASKGHTGAAARSAPPTVSAPASAAPGSTHTPPVSTAAARLPGKTISVAGKPLALRGLISTALAIVPAHCGCGAAIRQLLAQARLARVTVYLFGPRGSRAGLARLAAIAGPNARLATDARNVLVSAYRPDGLTVLLVDARGSVRVATRLVLPLDLEPELQLLTQGG